jgi:DNA modification methylase
MGSGTTCLAAVKNNREFIGIEKDEDFFNIAVQRLNKENFTNFEIIKEN